jgi:hypothetical protein
MGRMTWDGAGTVNRIQVHSWQGYGNNYNYFPYGLEVHDQVFKNAKTGFSGAGSFPNSINGQTTLSQGSIVRCQFKNCTTCGIRMDDQNTGNVWIRHCLFEDCANGFTGGGGETQLYNCIFRRSTGADISEIGWTVAARHCYSINSSRFINNSDALDGRPAILDGNVIIDPTGAPTFNLTGNGPNIVFDNTIRSTANATLPIIKLGCKSTNFLIGNTFTTGTPSTVVSSCATGSPGRIIDNQIVTASTINATEPSLPSTPSRYTGTIYAPTAFTGDAIQAGIQNAATGNPNEPSVVYLKEGTYSISNTIVIPKSARICLMGEGGTGVDGGAPAILNWTGTGTGPMLTLNGPSYATLCDFKIMGGDKAQAILVDNADQSEGRVLTSEMFAFGGGEWCKGYMCLLDGLDFTTAEFWDFMMSSGDNICARVIGGPSTAAGQATTACLNIWGTGVMQGSPDNIPVWDVQNNGRMLETDNWFEDGGWPVREPYVNLTNASSGSLTIQGYKTQYHSKGMSSIIPTMIFNGFSGKATIFGLDMANGIVNFAGASAQQNILFAGVNFSHNDSRVDSTKSSYMDTATEGRNVLLNCTYDLPDNTVCTPWDGNNTNCYSHGGNNPGPSLGNPTDDWLRDMMAQARTNHPSWNLDPTPEGATDVKLWRLTFSHFINGIQIKGNPSLVNGATQLNRACRPVVSFTKSLAFNGKLNVPRNVRDVKLFNSQGRMIASIAVTRNQNASVVTAKAIAAWAKNVMLIRAQ